MVQSTYILVRTADNMISKKSIMTKGRSTTAPKDTWLGVHQKMHAQKWRALRQLTILLILWKI